MKYHMNSWNIIEMIYLVPRKYSYSLMHGIMQRKVHVVKMTFTKEILFWLKLKYVYVYEILVNAIGMAMCLSVWVQ